jgi:hypothetical protein
MISLSLSLSLSLRLYSPLDLGSFISFLIPYTVGRTPWTGDQLVARPIPIDRTIQTQNKRTQISVHRVGFEHTIPVFKRAKTIHALDRAATVNGRNNDTDYNDRTSQIILLLRVLTFIHKNNSKNNVIKFWRLMTQ